ncbi:hypothetical protein D3C81_1768470 [compost metagenome]
MVDLDIAVAVDRPLHVGLVPRDAALRVLRQHLVDLRIEEAADHRLAADGVDHRDHLLVGAFRDVPLVLLRRHVRQIDGTGARAAARRHHLHADHAFAGIGHHQVDGVVLGMGGDHDALTLAHQKPPMPGPRRTCSASHGEKRPPSMPVRFTKPSPRSNISDVV